MRIPQGLDENVIAAKRGCSFWNFILPLRLFLISLDLHNSLHLRHSSRGCGACVGWEKTKIAAGVVVYCSIHSNLSLSYPPFLVPLFFFLVFFLLHRNRHLGIFPLNEVGRRPVDHRPTPTSWDRYQQSLKSDFGTC